MDREVVEISKERAEEVIEIEKEAPIEEVSEHSDVVKEVTLKGVKETHIERKTQFSDVTDNKVSFSDFYHDTRSFLDKTNSTKFILVCYLVIITPLLLVHGYISPDIYKDMIVLIALGYLGADIYEKKSLLKK